MLKIILTRLLTQHLKKVHNIVIEKAKSNHPLIHEGGLITKNMFRSINTF